MNRTNPKKICSHSENRNKVCLPCGRKIKYKKKEKPKVMNEKERNLVKKYCMKEFNLLDERYPTGKILSKSQLDKYISITSFYHCTLQYCMLGPLLTYQ